MIIQEPSFRVVRRNQKGFKKGTFMLVEPLVFRWEAKRCVVSIKTGAFTNFASIPVGFRNIFPVNGDHRLAAVVHDYLYWLGGVITTHEIKMHASRDYEAVEKPVKIIYSRAEADKIFYDLMLADNVKTWRANLMYLAVRVFGKKAWGTK